EKTVTPLAGESRIDDGGPGGTGRDEGQIIRRFKVQQRADPPRRHRRNAVRRRHPHRRHIPHRLPPATEEHRDADQNAPTSEHQRPSLFDSPTSFQAILTTANKKCHSAWRSTVIVCSAPSRMMRKGV